MTYVCVGFWAVLVLQSPKSQSQAVAAALKSVKDVTKELVETEKSATGPGEILTVKVCGTEWQEASSAVTEMVPPTVPAVVVILLVVLEPDHPPGRDQV